jgi:hypothetical protein
MEEDAKFVKEQWQETIKYPWTTYRDGDIRRQFQKHSVLGYAALEGQKFGKVQTKNEIILTKTKINSLFVLNFLHLFSS